jgi:threonine dehydratase
VEFSLNNFQQAHLRISQFIEQTPLKFSKSLSDKYGKNIYLKLETTQPGNTFKIRGAYNSILKYRQIHKVFPKQLISASGGNHGLAVSIVARKFNIPCQIVLPQSTPKYRANLLESYGANVLYKGNVWDEANQFVMESVEQNPDLFFIHPFGQFDVIEGQGSIGVEIERQLKFINNRLKAQPVTIVGSIGGGGLMAGIGTASKLYNQENQIIGVETIGADYFNKSLKAEKLTELDAVTSIAKSLGAKVGTQEIYELLSNCIDLSITVEDKNAVEWMQVILENEKILVEPATSCIFEIYESTFDKIKYNDVIMIICGANTSYEEFLQYKKTFGIN